MTPSSEVLVTLGSAGMIAGLTIAIVAERSRSTRGGRAVPHRAIICLATSAAFVALGARPTDLHDFIPHVILATTLLAVTVIDWCQHRVPNRLIKPATALSLAACALLRPDSIELTIFGGVLFWGIFRVVHAIQPAGLGMGDVRLAGFIGLHLGSSAVDPFHTSWRLGATLATASAIALTMSLWLHICDEPLEPAHRLGAEFAGRTPIRQAEVPFGPALSIATALILTR